MSKVNNMSMVQILNSIDINFYSNDIYSICSNKEAAIRIYELINAGKDFREVLIDNEEYIDKEKLLFTVWLFNKEEIEKKKSEISNPRDLITKLNKPQIEQEIRDLNRNLLIIKDLSKGMDIYFASVSKKGELINDIKIKSSKEKILGFDFSEKEKHNKKIFDYIDKNFVDETNEYGMMYALQLVEYEDFVKAMPKDIAQIAEFRMRKNTLVLGQDYIEKFQHSQENSYEAKKIEMKYKKEVAMPEIRNTIKEVLKYIDIEKLLLIEIYRLEKELDNDSTLPDEKLYSAYYVTDFLLKIIEKDTEIKNEDGAYTYKDALDFLDRINFEKKIYITRKDSEDLKEKILNGLNIETVSEEILDKLCMLKYTSKELDNIMQTSQGNFTFAMTMQNLTEEQILEKAYQHKEKWSDEITEHFYSQGMLSTKSIIKLYSDGIIDGEFFKEFSSEKGISEEINLYEINQKYKELKKQKEPEQEDVDKLNKMIELYKVLNINEKTQEELEEMSNSVMYEIAENFEDEEDIFFYYKHGLITLNIVASWGGESLVERLYNENEITLNDLIELEKNNYISETFMQSIYEEILLKDNLNQNDIVDLLIKGNFKKEFIEKLYVQMLIDSGDLKKLVDNNIITIKEKYSIQDKRSLEKAEEKSPISFAIGSDVQKVHPTRVDGDHGEPGEGGNSKEKTIIDPEIRERFFELLGFTKVKPDKISMDSPFYDYEFYMLLDKNSEKHLNSPIIAERYYENKETQERFATDNATYFFQYADLMVLSNYAKKDGVVNQKENVVYRAIHTLANEERNGRWANDVIANTVRTLLSSDLKEYNKEQKGLIILEKLKHFYTLEQLRQIFKMQESIDSGEYLYDIVDVIGEKHTVPESPYDDSDEYDDR